MSDKKPGETLNTDRMTVGDAAAALAGIFGQGTCGEPDQAAAYRGEVESGQLPEQGIESYLQTKYPGVGGAQELAAAFGIDSLCPATMAPTGRVTLPVYVHASSQAVLDDYVLHSYDSAKSGPKIVHEDILVKFEFSNTPNLPIHYFVDSKKLASYLRSSSAIYEWRGGVKNNRGEFIDPPPVNITGGQIHLPGYYSGILLIHRLPIIYHTWKITLGGVMLGGGQREYTGLVSAFSQAFGLDPVDQELGEAVAKDDPAAQCPATGVDSSTGSVVVCKKDPVTGDMICDSDEVDGRDVKCFVEVNRELRRQCTDEYVKDLPTEYRPVTCPDTVTPTNNSPAALNYNPALPKYYHIVGRITVPEYTMEGVPPQITADEYKKKCCHNAVRGNCIPHCRETKSVLHGPVEPEGGREVVIAAYKGKTVLIPVLPISGVCGTLTKTLVDPPQDCVRCPGSYFYIKNMDAQVKVFADNILISDTYDNSGTPGAPVNIKINLPDKSIAHRIELWYTGEGSTWWVNYDYFHGEEYVDGGSFSGAGAVGLAWEKEYEC